MSKFIDRLTCSVMEYHRMYDRAPSRIVIADRRLKEEIKAELLAYSLNKGYGIVTFLGVPVHWSDIEVYESTSEVGWLLLGD